ncbi:MAG: OmpA family protein, partial [Sulfitobacter sp.]|nr:OmpA family protein [Sulfitobacter sp.]
MILWRAGLIWLLLAGTAHALDLSLPAAARQTVTRDTDPDSYLAPTSAFENGGFASVKIEGAVARSAWRLEAPGLTPLQIMRPLRTQLEDAGYRIVLDCSAEVCGGFDFRFAIETLPAPNMYVDLRQYQFVTAVKGSLQSPDAVVTLLVSTTDTSAYLQIVEADAQGPASSPSVPEVAEDTRTLTPDAPAQSQSEMAAALQNTGHVVLAALDFGTGTAALGQGEFDALANLAAVLKD